MLPVAAALPIAATAGAREALATAAGTDREIAATTATARRGATLAPPPGAPPPTLPPGLCAPAEIGIAAAAAKATAAPIDNRVRFMSILHA